MFWFQQKCNLSLSSHQTSNHMVLGTTWLACFRQISAESVCTASLHSLQNFLIFSSFIWWPYLILSHFVLCLTLSPHSSVFFSAFLLRCAGARRREMSECMCGEWGGEYPAEPLSPELRMTGSQPDGTEQVYSMWPPLCRVRKQGEEEGGVMRRKDPEIKKKRWGGVRKMWGMQPAEPLIHHCLDSLHQ